MNKRTWRSLIAAFLIFCALPIACHAEESVVLGAATAQACLSAPADNAADTGCACQEDCFCCSLVVPAPVFELPAAPTSFAVSRARRPGMPLDRSASIYHPPRG